MKLPYPFLILIFLFSVFNSTFGQDLKSYNLTGKVKSIQQTGYDVIVDSTGIKRGNKLNWYIVEDILVTFDTNGKESEKIEYLLDGGISERFISKRDSVGNILVYSGQGRWDFTETYKYNEIGQLIEKIHYYHDGTVKDSTKYQYDETGNLVETNNYIFDGSISPKEIYKSGNKIESIYYFSDGTVREDIKYNKYGYPIEETSYNQDGTIKHRRTTLPMVDGEEYKEKSIEEQFNIVSKYTYDTHGNWVIRIVSQNGKPRDWTERDIEYYDLNKVKKRRSIWSFFTSPTEPSK
jgi:hypothetical protein